MKYLFTLYALTSFIAGCTGATHQFWITLLCAVMALAFYVADKNKEKRTHFFD